jgi:hypothetical protein
MPRIVGQRLHGKAVGIDDLEQDLPGIDDLPGDQMVRGADHTRSPAPAAARRC